MCYGWTKKSFHSLGCDNNKDRECLQRDNYIDRDNYKDKLLTNVTNLQRTEDSHEPITGDGGEGENAGDDANHRVERVQLAEHSWKRK